jgi:AmmeMemoRadiSam system protein B/AmmeMemoRadiSam system protein A
MKKIRPASVAGKFYPEDRDELANFLENCEENMRKQYDYSARAIIVPHAGYVYSGQLASEGFQYLNKKAKNIFVIAPAHYLGIEGIGVSSFDSWETPLGDIEVNKKISQTLIDDFGAKFADKAIEPEHSLEVQVPFIQKFISEANIVPVLVGDASSEKINNIISHFWKDKDNAFVISSDLSHFYHDTEAQKIDSVTAEMIETQDVSDFSHRQACGYIGMLGLVEFAKKEEFSLIRINLQNSSVTSGDKLRVVGYGSWMLFEGTKEKFIKDNFSELLLDVCQKSIFSGLETGKPFKPEVVDFADVLQQSGASFVTLEIDGELRGCIGSIIAHQSLIEDISKNAFDSAFSDSRFSPLTREEYEDLDIAISLLSAPSQMIFRDEADLLSQIEQDVDGIIIKDGHYRAVYLPSVWEQLPDKKIFLNSLKQKAGLSPSYFAKTLEAYRFRTEYIKK